MHLNWLTFGITCIRNVIIPVSKNIVTYCKIISHISHTISTILIYDKFISVRYGSPGATAIFVISKKSCTKEK